MFYKIIIKVIQKKKIIPGLKNGNKTNSNNNNNPQYPIGVGNYSNKNKMINFDKKAANKGALPVIMKKQNQNIINNKQEKSEKIEIDLGNQTNNNDISGVNLSYIINILFI